MFASITKDLLQFYSDLKKEGYNIKAILDCKMVDWFSPSLTKHNWNGTNGSVVIQNIKSTFRNFYSIDEQKLSGL